MRLEINGTMVIEDADEESVQHGLSLLVGEGDENSFASLSRTEDDYVQALGNLEHGFYIEYRDELGAQRYGNLQRALTSEELREFFLLYLEGNDRWRTEHRWTQLEPLEQQGIPIQIPSLLDELDQTDPRHEHPESEPWPSRDSRPRDRSHEPPADTEKLVVVGRPENEAELLVVESILVSAGIGFWTNLGEQTVDGRSLVEGTKDFSWAVEVAVRESDAERARGELQPGAEGGGSSAPWGTNYRFRICLALAVTFLVSAAVIEWRARAQDNYREWVRAEAKIISLEEDAASYSHWVHGRRYLGTAKRSYSTKVGEVVRIRYDPEDPAESIEDLFYRSSGTSLHRSAFGLLLVSAVFFVLAARGREEPLERGFGGGPIHPR